MLPLSGSSPLFVSQQLRLKCSTLLKAYLNCKIEISRKSCFFEIQNFEIDFSGVDWQEIISNTKELGRDVDRMADGSSITHFVTILFDVMNENKPTCRSDEAFFLNFKLLAALIF